MASKFVESMKSRFSTTRGKVTFIVIVVAVVGGIVGGLYLWNESATYVSTDNARLAAPLIPVSTLSPCQVISLDVDYGSYVERGQRIATVGQPRPDNVVDRLGFKEIPLGRADIEAPVSGYVAAVWTYPGAMLSAGSPLVTIYDNSNTWVSANINETKLHRVQPGQEVEVTVDSLGGRKLKGKVVGISASAAATFSLLPQNTTTGNFIKVEQLVPVKISIDNPANEVLVPGTSVEVKIKVR